MTGAMHPMIFAALMLCPATARAADPPRDIRPAMDCDCRANGLKWRQGEETCVNGAMQVCGMHQNVSAWIETKKPCPTAGFSRFSARVAYALDAACFSSRSE